MFMVTIYVNADPMFDKEFDTLTNCIAFIKEIKNQNEVIHNTNYPLLTGYLVKQMLF